jgi:hypothetical protein
VPVTALGVPDPQTFFSVPKSAWVAEEAAADGLLSAVLAARPLHPARVRTVTAMSKRLERLNGFS